MIRIVLDEEKWEYVVLLNNVTYTTCTSFSKAEDEAMNLRRELRYGR